MIVMSIRQYQQMVRAGLHTLGFSSSPSISINALGLKSVNPSGSKFDTLTLVLTTLHVNMLRD